tara:strand:- start:248 stop:610 length:363 start_codon:yes stop_codon:yes gene_type:complete
MALEYSVTLLADHKGVTLPKAVGDEYVVDAVIDVTKVVAAGSEIPASALGLSSIHCVSICGDDNPNNSTNDIAIKVVINSAGAYASATSFALKHTTMSSGTTLSNDANGGSVRVRVWGNL